MDLSLLIVVLAVAALAAGLVAVLLMLRKPDTTTPAIESLTRGQSELAGRLDQLSTEGAARYSALSEALAQRLDAVANQLGENLKVSATNTASALGDLRRHLTVIDQAQKNITELSNQVLGLQDILANKQARGAFGNIQLRDIVTNILPANAYTFEAQLSNGRRADCLIKLPNPPGSIVVDAKFPLESYQALRNAADDRARNEASAAFRRDVLKHVRDIAERYIVREETAESALMFLPSEAIYAELHANFTGVVEESFRARVWIVSPTTLMATLNTVRAVLKDVSMREQAALIQREVATMMDDVKRLGERVSKLRQHLGQSSRDIDEVLISTKKIGDRGQRIVNMELGETGELPIEAPVSAELPFTDGR